LPLPLLLLRQSVKGKVVSCIKTVKSLKRHRTNLPTPPAPLAPAPLPNSAGTKPTSRPLEWAVSSHPIKVTEVESHPLEWAVASHPIEVKEVVSHPLVMEASESWEEEAEV
jgi:hypothetical protein